MRQTTVQSRCECQARLVAVLDENRFVITAHCIPAGGEKELSPAQSMGAYRQNFDIGWLCTNCGRNVLRSFSVDGLIWVEAPAPAPATRTG
jgi:hypothetical protein